MHHGSSPPPWQYNSMSPVPYTPPMILNGLIARSIGPVLVYIIVYHVGVVPEPQRVQYRGLVKVLQTNEV